MFPRGSRLVHGWQRGLQNGTEELLLPEGVFGRRHGRQQGVLLGMGFAVRRQICCCFGDLYPVNIGLHLELLHQFASLSDTSSVVGGHEAGGSDLLHWNADGTVDSGNLILYSFFLSSARFVDLQK